ncbi:bacteriochlorophyll 4-vinyl reductase [Guptibacillus spartinae]|uniref:bacteriochlorophyll 4-vinyl reductase n=1 Tax=Guptibacillus spartinae TaxID=3025679 RepID=UPI002361C521|nr:bacteriochlorophyll 4-vinyl reductase [Pseudalkalibacillus spartinae]
MANKLKKKQIDLTSLIDQTLKVPTVKVDRKDFLTKRFADRVSKEKLNQILALGPYKAGINRSELDNVAKAVIHKRSLKSAGLGFATGVPGGLAMAGTIPADLYQFFGNSVVLAQELAYLYGHDDLWLDEHTDMEEARNEIIMFLGVMFSVAGTANALKFISNGLSKQLLKKLPQKALTKTLYYPIIKKSLLYIGIKVNKDVFAKGVAKVVPVLGGAVGGTLTYISMRPMGNRLYKALSEALVLSEEGLYDEYKAMKEYFPDIIDIDFSDIDN